MKGGIVTIQSTAGKTIRADGRGRHDAARTCRRPAGLAVLAASAAIGLAACGGSTRSPQVASLGTSSSQGGGSSASSGTGGGSGASSAGSTAAPTGNPARLLDEWAACMRRHGDPGQADPTITASEVIDITWNAATPGGPYGTNKGGQGNDGPGQYCRAYLNAAQTALGGGQRLKQPSQARLEKFSKCMRANGIPDFPDPTPGGGLSINLGAGGDLNPNNPAFRDAAKLCAQKTGVTGFGSNQPQPGTVELNGETPGSGG